VVDASVAVKWLLRDEPDADRADALLVDSREGRGQLLAPAQIRFEVSSAVRNAVRSRRLTPSGGRDVIADFLTWGVRTVDNNALVIAGFEQSLRFGCSF
jgi:predicted nucleic acid-binding protein